jgi:biopolymer transport protein TolR
MAQINVTPLVDVMLVLLVILMITAPMLQQGVSVNLPQATTTPLSSQDTEAIVTVSADGKIHLNDTTLSVEELQQQLNTLAQTNTGQAVRLRADKTVPYGLVAEVMAAVRSAGITKIGMITVPRQGRG